MENSAVIDIVSNGQEGTGVEDAGKTDAMFEFRRVELEANETRKSAEAANDESGLQRGRPFSASMVSRKSTQSRASISPSMITTDYATKNLFAYRNREKMNFLLYSGYKVKLICCCPDYDIKLIWLQRGNDIPGLLDSTVEVCKKSFQPELDGEMVGAWLLTEIDHWDMEHEMVVLLTSTSLLVIKYDFIGLKIKSTSRIQLKDIQRLQIGDMIYPSYSVMPPRENGGLRIHWKAPEPTFLQKWNPWCSNVGFTTLTHHLLIFNEKEKETTLYNVSDLADSLIHATNQVRRQGGMESLQAEETPIEIESYASIASLVYNQSHIGFNMERGGVSF